MGASTRWTSGRSGTTRVASTRSKGSSSQPSRTSSLTKARTPLCAHFGISRRQPGQGVHQHALVQRDDRPLHLNAATPPKRPVNLPLRHPVRDMYGISAASASSWSTVTRPASSPPTRPSIARPLSRRLRWAAREWEMSHLASPPRSIIPECPRPRVVITSALTS